jgi:hypothetical protein
MVKTPQDVAVSAFRNHLLDYDPSLAAQRCRVPIAYIAATNPMQSQSIQAVLPTAYNGADHRLGPFCSARGTRTDQRDDRTIRDYICTLKNRAEESRQAIRRRDRLGRKSIADSATNYATAVASGAVLAMAQHQLNQREKAREALAHAVELLQEKVPKLESGDLG